MAVPDEATREGRIESVEQLDDLLSAPTPAVIETMGRLRGDIIVLGVGGKMGPSLARMARRASDAAGVARKVIGVSRVASSDLETLLRSWGVETVRCDLLDSDRLEGLPDAANVIYMVGMKFGATGAEPMTWAVNTFVPGLAARRYRGSRLVALSTGNVYGMTPVAGGGSSEGDPLKPVGDYAMSCLGRERIIDHFSRSLNTPVALIRLNYATEMRYGVLVDLAQRVAAGETIDLSVGHFNAIWQGDANAMALQAFDHAASPPFVVNISGELLSVRDICIQLGRLMDKQVTFASTESDHALLSDGTLGHRLFGPPRVTAEQMIGWTADWITRGQPTLGKPTRFEVRDGKF